MTSTDESIGGWREHPDFSTYSDARLDQAQRLIDENIRWAKQAGDPTLETYNEQEMRMLQAERGRRQGGQNALLVPKGDIGKAKHFNPVSAAELLSRVTAVIPYLLFGFIAKGTLNLLIAYMKTGKSTLVYRLIICIAQGLDFLERKTDRGAVLILAVEEHVRDVERRLKRFGLREDDPVYVHVGTVQEQSETLKTIKNFVIEKKIVLVVNRFAFPILERHGREQQHGGNQGSIAVARNGARNGCSRVAGTS